MLEADLELLLHAVIKVVLLAEVLRQGLGSVPFVDDNLLNAVLSDVDLDVELRIALIDLLAHVVELLVHEVLVVLLSNQLSSVIRVSCFEVVELLVIDRVDFMRSEVDGLCVSLGSDDMSLSLIHI